MGVVGLGQKAIANAEGRKLLLLDDVFSNTNKINIVIERQISLLGQ